MVLDKPYGDFVSAAGSQDFRAPFWVMGSHDKGRAPNTQVFLAAELVCQGRNQTLDQHNYGLLPDGQVIAALADIVRQRGDGEGAWRGFALIQYRS